MTPRPFSFIWFLPIAICLLGCAAHRQEKWSEISIQMNPKHLTAAIRANGGQQAWVGIFDPDEGPGDDFWFEFRDYDAVLYLHGTATRINKMVYWKKEDLWDSSRRASAHGVRIKTLKLNPATRAVAYEKSR